VEAPHLQAGQHGLEGQQGGLATAADAQRLTAIGGQVGQLPELVLGGGAPASAVDDQIPEHSRRVQRGVTRGGADDHLVTGLDKPLGNTADAGLLFGQIQGEGQCEVEQPVAPVRVGHRPGEAVQGNGEAAGAAPQIRGASQLHPRRGAGRPGAVGTVHAAQGLDGPAVQGDATTRFAAAQDAPFETADQIGDGDIGHGQRQVAGHANLDVMAALLGGASYVDELQPDAYIGQGALDTSGQAVGEGGRARGDGGAVRWGVGIWPAAPVQVEDASGGGQQQRRGEGQMPRGPRAALDHTRRPRWRTSSGAARFPGVLASGAPVHGVPVKAPELLAAPQLVARTL